MTVRPHFIAKSAKLVASESRCAYGVVEATSRPFFLATSQVVCVERSTIIIPIIKTWENDKIVSSFLVRCRVRPFVVMYGSFHTTVGPVYLHDTPLSMDQTSDTSTSIQCASKLTCSATRERLADTGKFVLDPDDLFLTKPLN